MSRTPSRSSLPQRAVLDLGGPEHLGAETAFLEQLRQHERRRLVERGAAGDAEDGVLAAPGVRNRLRLDGSEKASVLVGFLVLAPGSRASSASFAALGALGGFLRHQVVVGERVDDDLGRLADLRQALRVERSPVGIGLRQPQALDDDLVVVVDERARH